MLTSRSTATMCSFLSLSITELSSITVETKVKGVSSTKRGFCKKGKKSYCIELNFWRNKTKIAQDSFSNSNITAQSANTCKSGTHLNT